MANAILTVLIALIFHVENTESLPTCLPCKKIAALKEQFLFLPLYILLYDV